MLRKWGFPLFLLLILFATRLYNLTALPLHNDEGLHLTRAVEVWNLHPFWDITDGKIINHWPIAALYPQNASDFVARVPTIFVAMLGLAAGYALISRLFGTGAALWAAIFWIGSPYLFFYERLAQSDAEAGALAIVAVLAAVRLAGTGRVRDALLVGVFISLATLMKLTAAPYALTLAGIIMVFGAVPYLTRLRNLIVIGVTGILIFAIPIGYLAVSGRPFFVIALGWVDGGERVSRDGWESNLSVFIDQWTDFGVVDFVWPVLLMAGLVLILWYRRSVALRMTLLGFLPAVVMIVASSTIFPRHFVAVALPLVLLAGAGWGCLIESQLGWGKVTLSVVVLASILASAVPVWRAAYHNPEALPAPRTVQLEYIQAHSSGVGLREAVLEMPQYVPKGATVIASMFPASCRRANFYNILGYEMFCTDAPGREAILAELNEKGEVFVLVEASPLLGIDVATVDARSEQLARYPRPGGISAVELYRLTVD
ncbi:MAG: glycosyltransferase family 39 protein [Chloroflexota bacterium]